MYEVFKKNFENSSIKNLLLNLPLKKYFCGKKVHSWILQINMNPRTIFPLQ